MDNYNFNDKILKPDEIDILLYHGNCIDGFTSAFCCWYYLLTTNNKTDSVKFISILHGMDPPNVINKNVLICDFSFKKNVMINLVKQTRKLLILDHHISSKLDLEDIDDNKKVFDMSHCGAYITWKYFFGDKIKVPKLIHYVEDNDLWLKKQPNTLEFTSFINTVPFKFEEYSKFLDNKYIENIVFPLGTGMVIQNKNYIDIICKKSIPHFMLINNKYYFIAHVYSDILRNEIANNMLEIYPFVNFSVVYTHNLVDINTGFSLRSDDTRTNVSNIATCFNGGGHRNAAGCGTTSIINYLPCKLIDHHNLYNTLKTIYYKKIYNHTFVLLNTQSCNKHIVKYLMQYRTNNIQECSFILNKNKNSNIIFDGVIAYYSINKLKVTGNICLKHDLSDEKKLKLVNYFNINNNNSFICDIEKIEY